MRVEVFRASDGLRLFELEQPGRGLCAETAPGRLVVGFEDHKTISFLDLDVTTRSLRRINLPPDSKRPLSFAVNPNSKTPELLVRIDDAEEPLLRLGLSRITTREAVTRPGGRNTRCVTSRSTRWPRQATHQQGRSEPTLGARALRDARPESKLIRRLSEAESARLESKTGIAVSSDATSTKSPRALEEEPLDEAQDDQLTAGEPSENETSGDETEFTAVPLVPEIALGGPPQQPQPTVPHRQALRAYDAQRSPAAWQWELARWAQGCLTSAESAPPPQSGPLHELSFRLSLDGPWRSACSGCCMRGRFCSDNERVAFRRAGSVPPWTM